MTKKDTKSRIKDVALELFNRDGFVNVRLQHISDVCGLSLGNIGYHFRTKNDILYALFSDFLEEQKLLLSEFRVLPLFEDFNRFLNSNFELQKRYVFFYKDALDLTRLYENISKKYREHLNWQELQLQGMLVFNEARGALDSKGIQDFTQKMSSLLVWASESWISRQAVTGAEELDKCSYLEMVWFLLKPYFTETGEEEFENRVVICER
ncbi:TetR/AcrR family transcriptional regulator [Cecembia rubra]|jgi:AcrR family transcriptional regulator|uniref:TetR family transcriptional regulator n=1 Tax=Cecembia rubra TaxID=1485585 RepID=A0A2P8E302_9BACT|nr:TetR/AcrR family transcriptional regulator [Cecembia rubra]PSL03852.1 TetR family transcriptional regulator [Cecembia rubra]